jgi:NAD dependent epimerase/dehydratase family enzyme
VTNRELIQSAAGALKKPLWLPGIPAFILRIALGEMSSLLLESIKASDKKIQDSGYRFQYPTLEEALQVIL